MEFRNPVPRWRWHVKAGLASMISAVGAKRRSSLRMGTGYRPLVLGYHRVVEDYTAACRTEMPSMLISTAMFERHLDWLGQHFRFVDLNEVGEAVRTGVPFETPVAAITFDDGYRDIHDLAMPILNRKGIPAALFVVTDLVGRPGWQMHDKLIGCSTRASRCGTTLVASCMGCFPISAFRRPRSFAIARRPAHRS
jgi:hypothetical protein